MLNGFLFTHLIRQACSIRLKKRKILDKYVIKQTPLDRKKVWNQYLTIRSKLKWKFQTIKATFGYFTSKCTFHWVVKILILSDLRLNVKLFVYLGVFSIDLPVTLVKFMHFIAQGRVLNCITMMYVSWKKVRKVFNSWHVLWQFIGSLGNPVFLSSVLIHSFYLKGLDAHFQFQFWN